MGPKTDPDHYSIPLDDYISMGIINGYHSSQE